jgi:hypothetical protein
MKYILFILFLSCFTSVNAQLEEAELEKALFNLPDVQFKKHSQPGDKFLKYVVRIKQPLDHAHPEKGFFYQSAVLTHKGFDKPTVMETEGYEMRYGGNEMEKILHANNINIEHRYFGTSRPDSLQWEYLTYEQVMADLHRINQVFRNIYKSKWISTGISRGGQTAIYYKWFYPEDVDLAVPYVAAIPNSLEDKRIYHFLDTIGTSDCRKKIFEVQRFLLQHEAEAVNKLKWYTKGKGFTFAHFGSLEKAFEFMVLEYPFSFWQFGSVSCQQIPVKGSVDEYLDHLLTGVGGIEFVSDKSIKEWAAHHYMARSQSGYYGYDLNRLKRYLKHIKGDNPSANLLPDSMHVKPFDSSFTQKVHQWLEEKGNNIIYINGSIDTWAACRVLVSNKVNAKSYLIPDANHYKARVRNMPVEMQQDFAESVKKILQWEVDMKALK